ncbi:MULTISPECIES: class I SAM-dependent methyltransferase [Arthrobacter]|uniref:Class I SAM-dependent methyltransferase n=2 Tax=Arthrobacter TaxID=1663 RepID=A0ABU9KPF7_9MICC|nr:class I SAM-dependent methyltransferase [Arthrobacter sp. YJM1]MDP5228744.1 class I SAM-dependent methyltransferase [Arthrobacter sp. YJM1]
MEGLLAWQRHGLGDLVGLASACGRLSTRHIELFGAAELAHPDDRRLIRHWGSGVSGQVLDAGYGPGHWSAELEELGCAVTGVDITPAFLKHARRSWPAIRFLHADLTALPFEAGCFGGVLAWYSLVTWTFTGWLRP